MEPRRKWDTMSRDSLQTCVAVESLDIRHLVLAEPVPSQANGVHRVAGSIVREQVRHGHDARVVFLTHEGGEMGMTGWDVPIQTFAIEGHRLMGHVVQLDPRIIAALAADATERTIVHIHGGRHLMLLSVGRELARRKIRYVVTVHGRYSHVFDENLRILNYKSALYLSLVERWVLERAHFVQAVTPLEVAIVRHVARHARIELVGHAAYSSAFDGAPARPTRVARSRSYPTFAFCGRYAIKHKGLDLLVEGFGHYVWSGGPGRLELAGTGSGRDELQGLVDRLGLAERVSIRGPLFGPEKLRAMQRWDYFVQASRFDVLPTGALEAALNGIPLIVSTATGLHDAVERFAGGFVIGEATSDAVAASLWRAARVAPEDWAGLSRDAHAMMVDIGDWSSTATVLETLYGVGSGS